MILWTSDTQFGETQTTPTASSSASAHNATMSAEVASGVSNVNRIFSSSLTYKKGAAVLHMLRNEIDNDSLFFGGVRQYLNAKRHSVATTDEFRQIMEQYTGAPLADFFQDWVYGEGHPTYDVRWNWRDSVLWVQTSQTTSAPTVTPVSRYCKLLSDTPFRSKSAEV